MGFLGWTFGITLLLAPQAPSDEPVIEARRVTRIQVEPEGSPYDWGPSVMLDGGLYKMWWTRLGGDPEHRLPHMAVTEDGAGHDFTYPAYGDRIYYAESRDGVTWRIGGSDFTGAKADYGPGSQGPLLVLAPSETAQEFYHVARPCVIKVDGTYYMYYESCAAYWASRDDAGKVNAMGEFQNQVFVATSEDGKTWRKHPSNASPQPIVEAPAWNLEPGHWRYGLGQPSVYYRGGRYVMHYVDSCTGPGDFMVRLEADNPFFEEAQAAGRDLRSDAGAQTAPAGSVSRHAQTQLAYLGNAEYLIRPAYDTPNLGLLGSTTGVFTADAAHDHPNQVYPQLAIEDPRGPRYQTRLYPCFLTTPHGELLVEDECAVIYFSSASGFKDAIGSWDLLRCEIPLGAMRQAAGTAP